MTDRLASLAALLRAREPLLAAFAREGVTEPRIDRHIDDLRAYLQLHASEGALGRLQHLLASMGVVGEPTIHGLLLPIPDLRGKRGSIVAARVVGAFHRFFTPLDARSGPWAERPITEDDRPGIIASLRFHSIEVDGGIIVVDGFESRLASTIVGEAIDTIFRTGTRDDVERLLWVLSQPVVSPVPPDADALRRELDGLLASLVRPRTLLSFRRANVGPRDTHLHGPAYLEAGEWWPYDEEGPMDLLIQIAPGGPIPLPQGVQLLQVFVGAEIPWDIESKSLHVKAYTTLHPERQVAPPPDVRPSYAIDGSPDGSLPDFGDLARTGVERQVKNLCERLDDLVPEDAYALACARFVHAPNAWTFAGGRPRWAQGGGSAEEDVGLVFQLGSSREPDLLWADSGVVYLFCDVAGFRWQLQSG